MSPGTAFHTRCRVVVASARFFPRSEVTSWNTARVSVSGAGGPAMSGTSERPMNAGSAAPRARFNNVGAMSTWPTGTRTRRGAIPGTRTMNGTLVCAG